MKEGAEAKDRSVWEAAACWEACGGDLEEHLVGANRDHVVGYHDEVELPLVLASFPNLSSGAKRLGQQTSAIGVVAGMVNIANVWDDSLMMRREYLSSVTS